MCKFCKLETISEEIGEKSNGNLTIGRLKDGSRIAQIYFNRYIVASENINRSELVIENVVNLDGEYILGEKRIKIKYCPFCGEEL